MTPVHKANLMQLKNQLMVDCNCTEEQAESMAEWIEILFAYDQDPYQWYMSIRGRGMPLVGNIIDLGIHVTDDTNQAY